MPDDELPDDKLLQQIRAIVTQSNQSDRFERILEEGLQELSKRFDMMCGRCEKHMESNGNLRVETEARLTALESKLPKNVMERLQALETGVKIYAGGFAAGVALFISCAWSVVMWLVNKKG